MGKLGALVAMLTLAVVLGLVSGGNFYNECDAMWEPQNSWTYDGGNSLSLALVSNSSGSMIRSKRQFIYGTVSTMIQLVKGDSAGTVTTSKRQFIYVWVVRFDDQVQEAVHIWNSVDHDPARQGRLRWHRHDVLRDDHDEIDFKFLGNETGQPYTLHTNVYAAGVGGKEMQFRPWFDPTDGYHNYTISWTPCMLVWYVDGTPIRAFRNYERTHGVAFPTTRPIYTYSSIWAAEDWATQGGRVRADWTRAPFVASYRGIDLDVCECYGGDCVYTCARAFGGCGGLTGDQWGKMRWVQDNYRIYDYCADHEGGKVPGVECSLPQY